MMTPSKRDIVPQREIIVIKKYRLAIFEPNPYMKFQNPISNLIF